MTPSLVQIPRSTAVPFLDARVAVAYSLHECHPDRPALPREFCFTVRPGSRHGRVAAHVDSILLQDVTFQVSRAGVERIRRENSRTVIAFAVGTVRARMPAEMAEAPEVTFSPFRDWTFVLRQGRVPVERAEWVWFSGRRGVALGAW